MTVPSPSPAAAGTEAFAEDDPKAFWQSVGEGQVTFGAVICVAVSSSIESNSTSALRATVTVPWIGRTHANEDGFPAYSI